jgi:hypothetical protein
MNTPRTTLALASGLIAIIATATVVSTSANALPDHSRHGREHTMETHTVDGATLNRDLAQVRRATARFHDLDAALAAGYELGWVNGAGIRIIAGCVSHPTAGAMGYHYFNQQLMNDLDVDLLEPEVLVYAPDEDGELRLAAVEWVARGPNTNPPGVNEPPTVLDMPMHILNPAVGFYLMHAWIWQPNPAGMMNDWNPDVSCP